MKNSYTYKMRPTSTDCMPHSYMVLINDTPHSCYIMRYCLKCVHVFLPSSPSAYLQRRHDGVHQFSLQVGSVSQMSLVVVKCVVQVGDWAVCTQTQQ